VSFSFGAYSVETESLSGTSFVISEVCIRRDLISLLVHVSHSPSIPFTGMRLLKVKSIKLTTSVAATPSKPGTIYLGHIPHGFFESQMHSYFSQLGTITRLRLSRNRRTGKSKHFGWVDFAFKDAAEIVS